jgi:hypothetical protein
LKAFRPGDKADTGVLVRLSIIIDHALDSRVDTLNDCIKYTESVLTPGCTPIHNIHCRHPVPGRIQLRGTEILATVLQFRAVHSSRLDVPVGVPASRGTISELTPARNAWEAACGMLNRPADSPHVRSLLCAMRACQKRQPEARLVVYEPLYKCRNDISNLHAHVRFARAGAVPAEGRSHWDQQTHLLAPALFSCLGFHFTGLSCLGVERQWPAHIDICWRTGPGTLSKTCVCPLLRTSGAGNVFPRDTSLLELED